MNRSRSPKTVWSSRWLLLLLRRVQLLLTVRKFSYRNPYCERKIFAERLPTLVEPWARATIRYYQQITALGLATCGKGGTRLAARLGTQTSRDTILRRVMGLPDRTTGSVPYLGIDDFRYGVDTGSELSLWTWRVTVRSICFPIARQTPQHSGCGSIQKLRW